MASSGHRGRDDARGRRFHAPSELTRTARRDAGVPRMIDEDDVPSPTASSCAQSQDPRERMSCLRGGLRDRARNDEAVPIVHHDKSRWQLDSRFASGPATRITVGRGHRRGLDGPTMPKPFK